MFAVIETGGKQILVKKGESIFIEKISGEKGTKVTFDKVLVIDEKVGVPYLKTSSVIGTIEKQGKRKKVIIYRYKPKGNWKTKKGHRQPYTRVKIEEIKL